MAGTWLSQGAAATMPGITGASPQMHMEKANASISQTMCTHITGHHSVLISYFLWGCGRAGNRLSTAGRVRSVHLQQQPNKTAQIEQIQMEGIRWAHHWRLRVHKCIFMHPWLKCFAFYICRVPSLYALAVSIDVN
jgi:hypothetical protein